MDEFLEDLLDACIVLAAGIVALKTAKTLEEQEAIDASLARIDLALEVMKDQLSQGRIIH